MKKLTKQRQGFTLIEMTIVIFIISLLILIMIPNLSTQRKHAQNVHASAMTSVVQSQIDAYLSEHPNHKSVSYGDLKTGRFLTAKQVSQAKDEGVTISKNEASK